MSGPAPAVAAAECIAFLEILHRTPHQPCKNLRTASLNNRDTRYQLSFEKERDLASILAFLSSTKTDRNHIPALCLREDGLKQALELLIAVNEERPNDGIKILNETHKSFERLLQTIRPSYEGIYSAE